MSEMLASAKLTSTYCVGRRYSTAITTVHVVAAASAKVSLCVRLALACHVLCVVPTPGSLSTGVFAVARTHYRLTGAVSATALYAFGPHFGQKNPPPPHTLDPPRVPTDG